MKPTPLLKKSRRLYQSITYLTTVSVICGFLGCSTLKGSTSSKEIASAGPTILNARVEPSTIELTRELRPTQSPEVVADVKDFRSSVKDVKLKFSDVPIQLPMRKLIGTTWRVELPQKELQKLAISGKTISYNAHVIAMNENGQMAQTTTPVEIKIKAPDFTGRTTG